MESVEEDIKRLIKLEVIVSKINITKLQNICSVKLNTTNHEHYSKYYNQDLADKVYTSSKLIFDMFGYEKLKF